MSQELVGRPDEVLADLDIVLGFQGRIEYEAFAARFVRDHWQAIRKALAGAEVAACCGRSECGGECGNEWRGMESAPAEVAGDGFVLVERGALNLALNALRRDAAEGKAVRGEIADAIAAAPAPRSADLAAGVTRIDRPDNFDELEYDEEQAALDGDDE